MKIKIATKSVIGKIKNINQDSFVVEYNKYNQILFAIADGVGSYKKSQFASKISCDTVKEAFKNKNFAELSDRQINEWGDILIKIVIKNRLISLKTHIATTLTFVILVKDNFYVFHVGNTRFYQLKSNKTLFSKKLFQITNDHDIRTDKDQIFSFVKEKKFLSNSVSNSTNCYVDFYKLNVLKGQYILTSDGVHSFLKNRELKKLLDNDKLSLNAKVDLIYENAVFNGSLDDITIILFEIN